MGDFFFLFFFILIGQVHAPPKRKGDDGVRCPRSDFGVIVESGEQSRTHGNLQENGRKKREYVIRPRVGSEVDGWDAHRPTV